MKVKNIEQKFMEALTNLDGLEFVGVARLLKVRVVDEQLETRQFSDVFADMMENFCNQNRKRRRELLQIVKQASRK